MQADALKEAFRDFEAPLSDEKLAEVVVQLQGSLPEEMPVPTALDLVVSLSHVLTTCCDLSPGVRADLTVAYALAVREMKRSGSPLLKHAADLSRQKS